MGRRHPIITEANWDLIRANLFPAAIPAIGDWRQFSWHGSPAGGYDTWKVHSSQALAIDVFGTMQMSPSRDRIFNALAERWKLSARGEWELQLEWHDPDNVLRERRRSQIDALARSAENLVFLECKFTEWKAGTCSQTGLYLGVHQCNGNYELQTNPLNGKMARCALTGKGIRYWEHIPDVFTFAAEVDHQPCPFVGAWYQWMRNLVVCQAVATIHGLRPAFVIIYAEGPFSVAQDLRSAAWKDFLATLRSGGITIQWISYQELIRMARETVRGSEVDTWIELEGWVERKITLSNGAHSE